jgi:hypothetical protein
VTRFVQILDQPGHQHWGAGGERRIRLPPEPAQVADRRLLDSTLRERPWELDTEAADWVVNAGIGFLRELVPLLPPGII